MKIKKWLTNNFGLKILSLFLAIATWFYISWELAKLKGEEEKAIFSILRYDVVSKTLPIQLTIVGEVKEGYEIVKKGVIVKPETCVVIGPKNILNDVEDVRTVPIDVSGYSESIDKEIELAPIARGIAPKEAFVKVHIPIGKKPQPE